MGRADLASDPGSAAGAAAGVDNWRKRLAHARKWRRSELFELPSKPPGNCGVGGARAIAGVGTAWRELGSRRTSRAFRAVRQASRKPRASFTLNPQSIRAFAGAPIG